MAGEIIIRDPDGVEHVFPAGFDPRQAAAVVRQQAARRGKSWAERLGLNVSSDPSGAASAGVDLLEGAVSGVANTIYRGGDLIRRGLGMERVIDTPAAQQAMRTPTSVAGQAGRVLEQAAEFAVPLSRLSKAASALPWVPRVASEGAAGAATAAVQTGGDPAAMTVGAVAPAAGSGLLRAGKAAAGTARTAATGAAEGGLSGAVASVVRRAGGVDPKAALIQALKPRNAQVNFARELGLALPEIKASEQALGRPIRSLDHLLAAAKVAKHRVRAQYDQLAGPRRAMGSTVDLSSVADAIDGSIPKRVQVQQPDRAEAIRKLASAYRGQRFSLEDAETLLRETNAELDAYYSKFPAARGRAAAANPETAQLLAEAKALRSAIYTSLDAPGQGEAARLLQRRYGALLELEDTAYRRANVAARQQPESLSEQVGKVRAAADMARGTWRVLHGDLSGAADIAASRAGAATASYLKEQQTTDALIRRALEAFEGVPAPVVMPPQPRIAGALPPAATPLGPAPDRSFVRGVPAQPAQSERLALPPRRGVPLPPAPDPSYVRGVAADVLDEQGRPVFLSTPR